MEQPFRSTVSSWMCCCISEMTVREACRDRPEEILRMLSLNSWYKLTEQLPGEHCIEMFSMELYAVSGWFVYDCEKRRWPTHWVLHVSSDRAENPRHACRCRANHGSPSTTKRRTYSPERPSNSIRQRQFRESWPISCTSFFFSSPSIGPICRSCGVSLCQLGPFRPNNIPKIPSGDHSFSDFAFDSSFRYLSFLLCTIGSVMVI
ncbi:hypothetical protein M432DRAFT_89681 [Thermoascus aurantiacus ATCC 26904]